MGGEGWVKEGGRGVMEGKGRGRKRR